MEDILNEIEARVLGCLIEKELTTPEYYPLTLNSLTAACNQKSNRDPVLSLQETDVVRAIDSLRAKHLVWEAHLAGSRVPKYEHRARQLWSLRNDEIAALAVLLLRGAQTVGEIRTRSGRSYDFASLEDTEETLQRLIHREEGPLVQELERLPGHRETRFVHLLCGEPVIESKPDLAPEAARLQLLRENDRISELEEALQEVRDQLEGFRAQFEEFKRQFE